MADREDILIGIDAGTSVIKAIAFDTAGKQIADSAVANTYQEGENGSAVQCPLRTWKDCAKALRGLGDKVPKLARRTLSVAVTGQGDGTWLIDRGGEPVTDGWLWLDSRAAGTVRRLTAAAEDAIRFEVTGTGLNACQQGAQMAYMAEHCPELLEQATTAFHCKDWLYFKLTGVRTTDPSEACWTFGNYRTRRYDDFAIEALGLGEYKHLLPEIVEGTATVHPLRADAASASGLLEGTPVCLAYVDMAMTGIGAGLHTGEAFAAASTVGSTGVHMRAKKSADIVLNPDRTGYAMLLPFPDMVAQLQTNMAATLNIDWLLDLAGDISAELGSRRPSRSDLVGQIDGWLERSEPGALIYHPYISAGERGPFINPDARAGFLGLSSGHRFPDLMRAVVEGLGMAARDCYGVMGEIPGELRLTGGAARSQALRGILSAALDAPVRVCHREETGAAGAAMMAAVAGGLYPSMDNCIASWVTPYLGAKEQPDPELVKTYRHLYATYRQSREALEPVWERMARARTRDRRADADQEPLELAMARSTNSEMNHDD